MQRNFETLKTAIYRDITKNSNISLTPLVLSSFGNRNKTFHQKLTENKEKLNQLINNIDIRAISKILQNVDKKLLPNWYLKNQYVIDYNESGNLDFIIIKN